MYILVFLASFAKILGWKDAIGPYPAISTLSPHAIDASDQEITVCFYHNLLRSCISVWILASSSILYLEQCCKAYSSILAAFHHLSDTLSHLMCSVLSYRIVQNAALFNFLFLAEFYRLLVVIWIMYLLCISWSASCVVKHSCYVTDIVLLYAVARYQWSVYGHFPLLGGHVPLSWPDVIRGGCTVCCYSSCCRVSTTAGI